MNLTVPAFPYTERGLTFAQVRLDVTVDGQFFGENTGNCLPSGCAWADTIDVWPVLNDLDGASLDRQFRYTASGTLQGHDGVLDFGGPSGYTSPYSWAAFSSFGMTYPNPALFSDPVNVPIGTNAFSRLHNPRNVAHGVSTYTTASLCVTYSYECAIGAQPSPWCHVGGSTVRSPPRSSARRPRRSVQGLRICASGPTWGQDSWCHPGMGKMAARRQPPGRQAINEPIAPDECRKPMPVGELREARREGGAPRTELRSSLVG